MTKHKALLPLDGSGFSREVLPHIRRLLQPDAYDLVLLRVLPPPEGMVGMPPRIVSLAWPEPVYTAEQDAELAKHPIYSSQARESAEALAEEQLLPDIHTLRQAGYSVSVAVAYGDPAEEIIDFVAYHSIDLVVMATHGRTGLSQLVLGSVAEQVLRRVSVPVLLARPFAIAHDAALVSVMESFEPMD